MTNCPQHSDSINLIKGFFLSISKNPQFSSVEEASQIYVALCTTPYMSALNTAQISPSLHPWVAAGPVTFITQLAKSRHQVSLTPTGRMSGCLYNAIRRPDINF